MFEIENKLMNEWILPHNILHSDFFWGAMPKKKKNFNEPIIVVPKTTQKKKMKKTIVYENGLNN